ncbi:MAG TPA: YdcF family protein [Ideonella sp.]|nr:YdcF family protein [Ideonella sp.]
MLHLLLSPLTWLLAGAGVLLLTSRRGGWWWGLRAPALLAACGGLLLMTPLGANLLVGRLEHQVAAPDGSCRAEPPAAIVVLGGGFEREPRDAGDIEALSTPSLRRTLGAVELLRSRPGSHLVIAGGGPAGIAESQAMGALAQRLGVPAERIRLETASMSTAANLQQLAALQPPVERRIWLVSSAMHLPRALAVAAREGFSACAHPVDRRYVPPGGLGYYLPQSSALVKSEAALHEFAGSLAYAWR